MGGGPIIIIDPNNNKIISGFSRQGTAQILREMADSLDEDAVVLEAPEEG